jgi:hypothetical protein
MGMACSLPYGEDVAKPATASNRWDRSSTVREYLDRDQQDVARLSIPGLRFVTSS